MRLREQAAQYTHKLKAWLQPYLEVKPAKMTTHRSCIHFSSRDVSIIHLNKAADLNEVISFEKFRYENLESLSLILPGFFEKKQLLDIPCYWLLSPQDYQLFLIESLPVPQEEIRDAVSWRVRSLINYPIEEAVVDYFELPPKKNAPSHPMIAAIAAKLNNLTRMVSLMQDAGVPIQVIDIPEMALRNLAALYEDDEKSTGIIYFCDNFIFLNITRQKQIYFTRRMSVPTKEDESRDYEKISLDILRYFDYFQSHWRYPSPSRVFIMSDGQNDAEIAEMLSEYLLVKAEPFKLKSIVASEEQLKQLNKNFLLTLGCSLREEQ